MNTRQKGSPGLSDGSTSSRARSPLTAGDHATSFTTAAVVETRSGEIGKLENPLFPTSQPAKPHAASINAAQLRRWHIIMISHQCIYRGASPLFDTLCRVPICANQRNQRFLPQCLSTSVPFPLCSFAPLPPSCLHLPAFVLWFHDDDRFHFHRPRLNLHMAMAAFSGTGFNDTAIKRNQGCPRDGQEQQPTNIGRAK